MNNKNQQIKEAVAKIDLDKIALLLQEYPNLSYFFRSALHAYQQGMPLTYQRELNNPKKEVSFRLTEELMSFYNSLPMSSKTEIMERALGSYFYRVLG